MGEKAKNASNEILIECSFCRKQFDDHMKEHFTTEINDNLDLNRSPQRDFDDNNKNNNNNNNNNDDNKNNKGTKELLENLFGEKIKSEQDIVVKENEFGYQELNI